VAAAGALLERERMGREREREREVESTNFWRSLKVTIYLYPKLVRKAFSFATVS
jgi:hypothetical protein